jgi:hypothetical protein
MKLSGGARRKGHAFICSVGVGWGGDIGGQGGSRKQNTGFLLLVRTYHSTVVEYTICIIL